MQDTDKLIEELNVLKAKGWKNMNGDERARYQELKAQFPELAEGDSGTEETEPVEPKAPAPKTEETIKPEKSPRKAKVVEGEEVDEPREKGDYELLGDFRHNGTEYRKGKRFFANHELMKLAPKDIIKKV
jgi:hypothetical protein